MSAILPPFRQLTAPEEASLRDRALLEVPVYRPKAKAQQVDVLLLSLRYGAQVQDSIRFEALLRGSPLPQ